MLVGQSAQRRRRVRVRLFGVTKVRDRVALEAVGPTLEKNEFGLRLIEVCLDAPPGRAELGVVRARGDRDIQLGATRPARAGFLGGAGPRIEKTPVLVHVREDQVRVIFETVEHAITVMCVNIDVGDASEPVLLAQVLDGNAAIIENAESPGAPGRGMVQPGFIDSLLKERLPEHPGYYGEMVWILMMLEQWLQAQPPK